MAAVRLDLGGEVDVESLEMGLPISNAENKKLEAEVQRKEREITAFQRQTEHLRDRVQAMGDHLKNVQQELQQTQVQYYYITMLTIKHYFVQTYLHLLSRYMRQHRSSI